MTGMKIEKFKSIFGKGEIGKFSTESENFSDMGGGNLKHGGNASLPQRGMDAPSHWSFVRSFAPLLKLSFSQPDTQCSVFDFLSGVLCLHWYFRPAADFNSDYSTHGG